jgi:hypothetical protein
VVAEVGYLLGRAGGAKIEAAFLRSIVQETLTIVDLELADYERIANWSRPTPTSRSGPPKRLSSPSPSPSGSGERDRHARPSSLPRGSASTRR